MAATNPHPVRDQSDQALRGDGNAAAPMLEVQELGLTYGDRGGDGHTVFDAIDLTVERGDFLCVLGPSGCGKSTLLFVMAGLLQPSHGSVLMHGTRVRGVGRERGLVFQDFALFPWLSVEDNIAFGLRGMPRAKREARVADLVRLVGLDRFEQHLPHELSGGMQQRVAIASTLATDPEVLLMDEPFGALDAQTRQDLQGELVALHQRTHKTTVFVTHDIRESVLLADRIAIMGGRPAAVMQEIVVDLPRPRNEFGAEFADIAAEVRSVVSVAREAG